jgi:WD40 repeat protein
MAKLFVSYSRKDSVAARKLIDAFRTINQDVWVDWEAIPPAVDWLEQIFRGIEESDAFVFLISPDSIASEVCKVEINKAAQNNKRIIPIVLRDVHPKDAPEAIRKLNWTFMRETDDFEEGLAKVKTAIELDLDWLEEHRRLQVRALEWDRKKDPSLLLRGRDLRNARQMIATATNKDPIPTELQKTYIQHSLRSERSRNVTFITAGIAILALTILSFVAIDARDNAREQRDLAVTAQAAEARQRATAEAAQAEEARQRATAEAAQAEEARQRQIAEDRETEAEAQRSAARAQIYEGIPGELYTSTLLAIDSMARRPTNEAEEILRRNLSLLPRPSEKFTTQKGRINALAFHPSGNMFVTASADGSVCAWSIEEIVRESFCTPANGTAVNAIAFLQNGARLVTGDQAGVVQILDSESGEVVRTFVRVGSSSYQVQFIQLEGDAEIPSSESIWRNPVRSISVRPTRVEQIVVAYDDGAIPVLSPDSGNISARLSSTSRPNVTGVSPRGPWLVGGLESGVVYVWDLGNADRFQTSTHRDGVLALAFSPTENKIATAGSDTIAVANLSIKKELYRIPIQSAIRDITFSPDGTWFVTGSDDERIQVWETFSGTELRSMSHDGAVTEVTVSSDGRWIASTGSDRTARVWDAATGAQLFQIPLEAAGTQLAFANNDQWLVTTDASGAVAIWDISVIILPKHTQTFGTIVNHVQYSPSGEWLAVTAEDKIHLLTVDEQSIPRQAVRDPLDFDADVSQLLFSHDSALLGVLTEGNEVTIYDLQARESTNIPVAATIQAIAFAPDNEQLYTLSSDGNLQSWDILNPESPRDIGTGIPEGSLLASAGGVVVASTPEELVIISDDVNGEFPSVASSGAPSMLAISVDGSRIATGTTSGDITIFQYQNGELVKLSSFRKEQAISLAFSADKTLLAVGAARNVYLIDVASGTEVARISHLSPVNSVSFSVDEKYLVTASSRALRFWAKGEIQLLPREELTQLACLMLPEGFDVSRLLNLFPEEEYDSACGERRAGP